MTENISLTIIEDNRAFISSLEKMIRISNILSCAAIFETAEDCLDAIQNQQIPPTDVVLLDLYLPGKNGLTLIPFLRRELPDSDIVVLTSNDNYQTTLEAIRLGVSGYILKDASIREIRDAIFEVNDGGCVIDPQLSRLVLDAMDDQDQLPNPLSKREREVLELMALGYVKKEVAARLGISYRTVAQNTESIYKKLQAPNIAAAVATAIRKGLI